MTKRLRVYLLIAWTVQESFISNELDNKLKYELEFLNNQGRDLTSFIQIESLHVPKGDNFGHLK